MFALEIVTWSLNGFYDPISVACVVLSIHCLRKGDGSKGLLWVSLALFLHFRALWYFPLVPIAAWQLWRSWREQGLTRQDRLLLGLSGCMLLLSGISFLLLLGQLTQFPINNPVKIGFFPAIHIGYWGLGVPAFLSLLLLLREREWWLLGLLAWQLLFITQTRQIQQWHALFFLPMFVAAQWKHQRPQLLLLVLLMFWVEGYYVFKTIPFSGGLLGKLIALFVYF